MKRREAITLFGTAGFFGLTGFIQPAKNNSNKQPSAKKDNQPAANNLPAMKTIGILGGLGPQATMDIEMRLHKAAQRFISPMQNSGYPPIVVQYYRHPPVLLTDQHMPVVPWQPDPRLLDTARKLGPMADFIIIPSNGAHLFQQEIEHSAGRKVLSMIDITLEEVKKRKWKKIGVLGMMNPKVYTSRLQEMGLEFETISDELQLQLNQAIMKVMEGGEGDNERAIALRAIEKLRSKQVHGIIPGCTEIPLLLGKYMDAADIINPAQLLADAAIQFAIS